MAFLRKNQSCHKVEKLLSGYFHKLCFLNLRQDPPELIVHILIVPAVEDLQIGLAGRSCFYNFIIQG